MFLFASSRCSAGDPVSLPPETFDKPLVMSDGLNAMIQTSWTALCIKERRAGFQDSRIPVKKKYRKRNEIEKQ
jgi:hypothetical protein